MAEREIVTYPREVLRQQARSVSKIDAATRALVEDMVATMRESNGLGLAANQIGVLQKVFVYNDGTSVGALINPKIVSGKGEQIGIEGCLSVPGLQGEVRRANEVVVRGTDLKGKSVKIKAEGLLARIFQHEIDHLNGTLFIDRADPETLVHITDEEGEDSAAK